MDKEFTYGIFNSKDDELYQTLLKLLRDIHQKVYETLNVSASLKDRKRILNEILNKGKNPLALDSEDIMLMYLYHHFTEEEVSEKDQLI